MMRNLPAAFLLLSLTAAAASARDIYVDNIGGDDRHEGRAPTASNVGGGPCRTIARALRLARQGDRIILTDSGEPYRECVTLQGIHHSGSPERPFVILGNGATLDGAAPVHPDAWQQYEGDIHRFRPGRTSYQQLFLNDIPLDRVPVDNNNLHLPKLLPFQWCLFDRHIYLNVKKPDDNKPEELDSVPAEILEQAQTEGWRYSPQQYDLTYAHHPVGITLYDVRNVVIADLFVQGYQLDGINAHDKAFNAQLLGIVGRGNGRSGISVGGASRVKILQSQLRFNGAAQLRVEGYSVVEVEGTEILDTGAPSVVREGGEVSIDGLPLREKILSGPVDPARAPPATP